MLASVNKSGTSSTHNVFSLRHTKGDIKFTKCVWDILECNHEGKFIEQNFFKLVKDPPKMVIMIIIIMIVIEIVIKILLLIIIMVITISVFIKILLLILIIITYNLLKRTDNDSDS